MSMEQLEEAMKGDDQGFALWEDQDRKDFLETLFMVALETVPRPRKREGPSFAHLSEMPEQWLWSGLWYVCNSVWAIAVKFVAS